MGIEKRLDPVCGIDSKTQYPQHISRLPETINLQNRPEIKYQCCHGNDDLKCPYKFIFEKQRYCGFDKVSQKVIDLNKTSRENLIQKTLILSNSFIY